MSALTSNSLRRNQCKICCALSILFIVACTQKVESDKPKNIPVQPKSVEQAQLRDDGPFPLKVLSGMEMMDRDINVDNDVWMQHLNSAPTATSKKQCESLSGKWFYFQFNNRWVCDIPTPDANKICHDDRECTTFCAPNQKSEWYKKSEGNCYSRYFIVSCRNGMTNGFPKVGPCID